jgi:hypothetical protein
VKPLERESVSKLKENDGNAQFSLCCSSTNAGSRVKRDPAFFCLSQKAADFWTAGCQSAVSAACRDQLFRIRFQLCESVAGKLLATAG